MLLCHCSSHSNIRRLYSDFSAFRWGDLTSSRRRKQSRRKPNEKLTIKSALRLCRCGELSRAARALMSCGLADATDETIERLRSKHPSGYTNNIFDADDTDWSSSSFVPIDLPRDVIWTTLQKSPRGSAAGWSGWRFEHLKCLLSGVSTGNLLIEVLSLVASGHIPEFASLALSSSRLIALPKSIGDVRPIAIGEVFRRASARAICFHMRNHFARFFAPIQHGVSTSNGSEILIHHIQLLLDRHPDWVVLKTDVRNAFNSISRRAIAERLLANFPSLMPHFRRMYGHSGSLVFATDSEHVILSSEEGVHQGDPLGPFLFAVGIHDLVSRVQAEHPEAVVLAYLDDVFIIGPESVSADAFDQLKSLFGAIHLVVADYKCEIFARRSASSDLQLPRRSDGTVILGSPIGNEAFVSEKCLLFASQGKELCDKITTLEDPQCALLLLRHCHATRLNHLGRTISSTALHSAASLHDDLSKSTFMSSLLLSHLSDDQWLQASLPIRLGGFGVPLLSPILDAAFLAGWSHTSQALPDRFPSLWSVDDFPFFGSSVRCSLEFALRRFQESLCSSTSESSIASVSDLPSAGDKLQHQLKSVIDQVRVNSVFSAAPDNRGLSRLRSCQGKYAGRWLEALPSSRMLALKPCDFRLAASLRLGDPLPFAACVTSCNCGSAIDRSGYHLLTCKTGAGPVWAHNCVVSGWADCVRDAGLACKVEPRHEYLNNDNRPDIVAFGTGTGECFELDISLAHPWSSEASRRSASEDGAAASIREEKKISKYESYQRSSGLTSTFIPIVAEHFGRWGKLAQNFLQSLGRFDERSEGRSKKHVFLCYWRRRLSVLLQYCNSNVIDYP